MFNGPIESVPDMHRLEVVKFLGMYCRLSPKYPPSIHTVSYASAQHKRKNSKFEKGNPFWLYGVKIMKIRGTENLTLGHL